MAEIKNIITYTECENEQSLPAFWKELLDRARAELGHAYAPYSGFKVAAALKLANGMVLAGTNQENAAFPSGLCAERTLLFHALSSFPNVPIEGLAIVVSREGTLAAPCGACRQVMADIEVNRQGGFPVMFPGDGNTWLIFQKPSDLLPLVFTL
jgi:cytidine deaminase